MGASPEQQLDLSVTHPYAGEHKLIARLLAMKDVKEEISNYLRCGCTTKLGFTIVSTF